MTLDQIALECWQEVHPQHGILCNTINVMTNRKRVLEFVHRLVERLNKPVAWFLEDSPGHFSQSDSAYRNDPDVYPLYAAPVPALAPKELSNDEVTELINSVRREKK